MKGRAQRLLILASASPRRSDLLKNIGLTFRVDPSTIDELSVHEKDPLKLVATLAEQKAQQVAERYTGTDAVILGADTVVFDDKTILGKPRDAADAKHMLQRLSGRDHTVHTGMCLLDTTSQRTTVQVVTTTVSMRSLTAIDIEAYVASGEPLGKAGAYAIQGLGAVLIEKIVGDFWNVVGLPLPELTLHLHSYGIDVLCLEK